MCVCVKARECKIVIAWERNTQHIGISIVPSNQTHEEATSCFISFSSLYFESCSFLVFKKKIVGFFVEFFDLFVYLAFNSDWFVCGFRFRWNQLFGSVSNWMPIENDGGQPFSPYWFVHISTINWNTDKIRKTPNRKSLPMIDNSLFVSYFSTKDESN